MKNHLKKVHPDLWVALQTKEAAAAEVAAAEKQRIQEKDETAKSTVQIFNLRTFISNVIFQCREYLCYA